jgi:uncharacterized protein YcgI (DUF1989 family)
MSVVAGSLGVHGKFVNELKENAARSNANDVEGIQVRDDFAFDQADFNEVASPALRTLFNEAICINSTRTSTVIRRLSAARRRRLCSDSQRTSGGQNTAVSGARRRSF